jgi:glutamyl-tRNA reductase
MPELFVVGISWRTAPVALREKLAFRDDEIDPAVRGLVGLAEVGEAMLVSTCNRVEVYGVGESAGPAAAAARRFLLADRAAVSAEVGAALYEHASGDAIRHIFSVASALDSLVVGEAQILGQLKDAYGVATAAGATGPVLGRCVERAFGVAKRVRSETAIARGAANVSTVAVDLAGRVFGDLSGKAVLVVGAGKMSTLAARHLRKAGVASITVTNRSPERAVALADEIEALARPWADLENLLAAADVVISSTGAREPVLTRPLFKKVAKARRWKPIVVIDIAVPRDAEPGISDLEGVYLFDIDDLEKVVAANLAERQRAAVDATRIVDVEVGQFLQWARSQHVVPTIRALREHFAKVADAEVQRTLEAVAKKDLTPAARDEAIRRLGQLIVAKLLHQPQTVLRESSPAVVAARLEAVCALFGLDPTAFAPERASKSDDPDDAGASAAQVVRP